MGVVVAAYKVRCRTREGDYTTAFVFEAESDDQAIEYAAAKAPAGRCELLRGDALVWVFEV